MLLLLVLEMLEVLVVLKELVVFVRGKFERVKSPNFFWGKIIESKKKMFGAKRNLKILKTKSKIHLYFRVVHSIIPLLIKKGEIESNFFNTHIGGLKWNH